MHLVEALAKDEESFAWFADRPPRAPPAQLEEVIFRLRRDLPALAPDIAYGDKTLPHPETIPTTVELIAAHNQEMSRAAEPPVDYSLAPPMARDAPGADDLAKNCLAEIEAVAALAADTDSRVCRMAAAVGVSIPLFWARCFSISR